MNARFVIAGLFLGSVVSAHAIEVQGHRGARARRPENTLSAFRYAYQIGVDVIELDLAVTKDDRIVVTHDLTINPKICLGPTGARLRMPTPAIRSLTLEEIRRFDCGSLRNPDFPNQVAAPGEKMPTFEEFLDFFAQAVRENRVPNLRMNVETKTSPKVPGLSTDPESFVRLVLSAVRRHGLEDRLILQSFDKRTLQAARKLYPGVVISALDDRPWRNPLSYLSDIHPEFYSPGIYWLGLLTSKPAVQLMNALGIGVVPYTANTPKDWDRLIRNGVRGIITDDPYGLIEHLKQRGLR